MDTKRLIRQTIPLGVELSTPVIAARIYSMENPSKQQVKNVHHVMSNEEKWGKAASRVITVKGRSVKLWIRLQ